MICAKSSSPRILKNMERAHHPSTSAPKMERRIIEKNRRNHMKSLYSKLYSLLPSYSSREVLPVPDQIDEAKNHIESLEKKLEMYKEEKKRLQGKRPYSSSKSDGNPRSPKLTNVEIHDMGPDRDAIFITGMEDQASFYGIIRLLCEQGFEVVNANFSTSGNSMIQINHVKGASTRADNIAVSKRLKELIYGYSHGDEAESRLDLWDFEIEHDILGSDIFQVMPPGEFCFLQQIQG